MSNQCPTGLPTSCIAINSSCYDPSPRCMPGSGQLCPGGTPCPASGICPKGACAAIYDSDECTKAGFLNCGPTPPLPPPKQPQQRCSPGDMCLASVGKNRHPGVVKCPSSGICPGRRCQGDNICPDGKACPYNGICPLVEPRQQHCNPFSNPQQICENGMACPKNCGDFTPPYNKTSWCPCPHARQ